MNDERRRGYGYRWTVRIQANKEPTSSEYSVTIVPIRQEVKVRNSVGVIWIVGVLVLGVAATGQNRPNFSGRWVQISPAEGVGTEQRIKHEGDRMSTGHDSEGGGHGVNYRLDGVESRNVITSHGTDIVSKTRAAWDAQKLVITNTTEYPDGRTVSDKQSWSLDDKGQLRIEIARSLPGQAPMSITAVFSKRQRP